MQNFNKRVNQIGLFFVFIAAMYATFNHLTGISAEEIVSAKEANLGKSAKHYQPETMISSLEIEQPTSLADTLDLNKLAKVSVVATGYTAGIESTGKTAEHPAYGLTSSGVKVKRDLYSTIAADTSVFPFGTILYIPNYGYGVVADRGGAIKGNRLDLYFDTVQDVYDQWGKKKLDVYIVKKGNGKLDEETFQSLNQAEAVQAFRNQIAKK